MSDFHQSHRVISEEYRNKLLGYFSKLMQPEIFSASKVIDPQNFYLGFKNYSVPLISIEIDRLKSSLPDYGNSHLLLLKTTVLVDTVLQAAFKAAIWIYKHTQQKDLLLNDIPIAVMACGGYGREETYFRSDVGIQIISKPALTEYQAEEAEQIVKHLEYLVVHQNIFQTSVSACYTKSYSLEQKLSPKQLINLFSLLESRLVAGNSVVYSEFMSVVETASINQKDTLLNLCYGHKNYYEVLNTVFQQEPNVKEELNRLYWALTLVRLKHNIKRTNQFELLDELFEKELLSAPSFKKIHFAFEFLSKVRLFLHCHQKGSHRDVMSYEVREKIAQSMGDNVKTFFHKYFYEAAYPLKIYSRNIFWESMTPDTEKVKNLSRNFYVNSKNQILLDKESSELFSKNPIKIFKIFAWISEKNYFLSYPIVRAIEHHLDQMCPIFINTEECKEVQLNFKRVINGKYFSKALRLLHEFDLLKNFYIPEFKNICGLLQDIYVHHFPTDIHVLSALDVLNGLSTDESSDPFLKNLYYSIRDKTTLKLSVLLHDIGKGFRTPGQNEEILGARLVPPILENLGYSKGSRRISDVAFLVEKHLMMHDLLLLDPEEDDTYDMIWDLVNHDTERLKMLLLLTYSDRGGTKMKMSPSQIEQLKIFYQHTLHHKKRQDVPQLVKSDFLKMVRLPRDMQSHLEIYNDFCQSKESFACELLLKPTQGSELVICSKDRPNLLYNFSTVLAFNKLNVVEAKIHTLRDQVFDIFKIVRSSGDAIDYSDIVTLQNQIRDDLKRVCIDQETLSQIFKNRSLSVSPEQNKIKNIKLKMKIIGRSIKVETHDLQGTFMTLTRVFSQFNMEIHRAVLDTRQGTASNIFYLRPKDVHDIIENKDRFLRTLAQALRQLINLKEIFLDGSDIVVPTKQTLAI